MLKSNFLSHAFLVALLTACVTLAGCSDSGRIPFRGKVSFDGVPVEYGYVQFTPTAGTTGPTAGADIKDGVYEVASVRGLFEGSYQVEIKSWKRSEGVSVDPVTGERTPGGNLLQLLPAKYNKQTELTVKIEPAKQSYDFLLQP